MFLKIILAAVQAFLYEAKVEARKPLVQAGNDGGLGLYGSDEGGEKQSGSRYILKTEKTDLTNALDGR